MEVADPQTVKTQNWPLQRLRGVGPKVAEKLAKLGIESVVDLLFHLPTRYQDRTRVLSIGSLRPGDEAVVIGEVQLAQIKLGRRRSLLVKISDGTRVLTLRFFHFSKQQQTSFTRGALVRCFGELRAGAQGLEIVHPEYKFVEEKSTPQVDDTLTPIYPSTDGLQQNSLRNLTDQALKLLEHDRLGVQELIPQSILNAKKVPTLKHALLLLHRPGPETSVAELMEHRHPAQQRLAFEELLAQHLSLSQIKFRGRTLPTEALPPSKTFKSLFLKNLSFELTGAQNRVSEEISDDLSQTRPMMRLVQGDVGSGKTVVAALAALQAIEAGVQVAIMAPTELLAEQHFQNFKAWFEPLGIQCSWLAGKLKAAPKREALEALVSGEAQLIVGTHALFQDSVVFHSLGLVIIDEQHRFGVHQRLALRDKGRDEHSVPHQLVMTATPIPRTLAMTAYADLDVSVIDELPKGRQPIDTVVIPERRRPEIVARVQSACAAGRQVYWVCPLIEESELLAAQAAEITCEELRSALPDVAIGLVHGRMKPVEKESAMQAFKAGETALLVATTVIEVGVDVPNASLMIIENAERLGLSQLHQLRGRVGRGAVKSSCVLLYHGQLSRNGRERLAVMRETNDGFRISEKDLEIRGPGELLGTRQTGLLQLKIADLVRDQHLLPAVERCAELLFNQYPDNIPLLIRRWLPHGLRYSDV